MNNHIENKLWAAADQFWVNSSLKPSEYSVPVLGLIFLKYADSRFTKVESDVAATYPTLGRRSPLTVSETEGEQGKIHTCPLLQAVNQSHK